MLHKKCVLHISQCGIALLHTCLASLPQPARLHGLPCRSSPAPFQPQAALATAIYPQAPHSADAYPTQHIPHCCCYATGARLLRCCSRTLRLGLLGTSPLPCHSSPATPSPDTLGDAASISCSCSRSCKLKPPFPASPLPVFITLNPRPPASTASAVASAPSSKTLAQPRPAVAPRATSSCSVAALPALRGVCRAACRAFAGASRSLHIEPGWVSSAVEGSDQRPRRVLPPSSSTAMSSSTCSSSSKMRDGKGLAAAQFRRVEQHAGDRCCECWLQCTGSC